MTTTSSSQNASDSSSSMSDQPRNPAREPPSISSVEADAILTGKTLDVYKYMITKRKQVGPREIQRAFKLSSSGVASFHLDKLQKSGLITKNANDGSFVVNKVYLKHFFLLRSYLVPRYFLYAAMFSGLAVGWVLALYLDLGASLFASSTLPAGVFYVFVYGLVSMILAAAVFWYESIRVLKRESI
jgi:hypothetical protein